MNIRYTTYLIQEGILVLKSSFRRGSHGELFHYQEGIMTNNVLKSKPDYGFDGSPFGVTIVCFAGVVCFGGGIALITFPSLGLKIAASVLLLCGLLMVLVCGSYFYYIRLGKLRRRDTMISMVDWKGDETVLDIGTGRGLLLDRA